METATRIRTHFSREEVDSYLHQTGRGAGPELMYRCIFHEDRNPSLAVNLEKQVFHCFGCQKSGTLSELLRHNRVNREKIDNCSTTPSTTTINYFQPGPAPPPPETPLRGLALLSDLDPREWDGNLRYRAEKLLDEETTRLKECGVHHKADRCEDCNDNPASTWFCGHRLCTSCRRRRYAAFFEQHHWVGKNGGLNLVGLPMRPHSVQEPVNVKGQIGMGRLALSDLQKELEIPWVIYTVQPRVHQGVSSPVFWVLFPGSKLDLEHVKVTWAKYGHPLLPKLSAHFTNGHDAVWQMIEAASVPFAFTTDADFLICYQATSRLRSFESLGLKQNRVTGGMMKGRRKTKRTCPCCGGTNLKPLGIVPDEDVFWVDGVKLYLPDRDDPRRKTGTPVKRKGW